MSIFMKTSTKLEVLTYEFFEAAEHRDYRTLKKCLLIGVNPNVVRNRDNWSVVHVAAANGDLVLLDFMARRRAIDLNVKTPDFQQAPLHLAIRSERGQAVELLLEWGADVNVVNRNGSTPLHLAVTLNKMTIIKTLLRWKPNVNVVDIFANTPLSIAVVGTSSYDMAYMLLHNNADVNLPRPNSPPLLCEAILNSGYKLYMDLLSLLMKHGADVNEISENKWNALHYAALGGSLEIAEFLVSHKCDFSAKDAMNRTPRDVALLHNNDRFAQYLKQLSMPNQKIAERPSRYKRQSRAINEVMS